MLLSCLDDAHVLVTGWLERTRSRESMMWVFQKFDHVKRKVVYLLIPSLGLKQDLFKKLCLIYLSIVGLLGVIVSCRSM